MSWYWWILIYVFGAAMVFRTTLLNEMDSYQRELHKWTMTPTPGYDREVTRHTIEVDHKFGFLFVGLVTVFWPIALVCLAMYGLSRLAFWALFPRGIKTKFDREQELEREKKEAEQKFNEARALLAKEGIKI